jgi:hypothetical protein
MFISNEEKKLITQKLATIDFISIGQDAGLQTCQKDVDDVKSLIELVFQELRATQIRVEELEAKPMTITLPALRKINEDREKHRKSKQSGYMKKWYAQKQIKEAATAADAIKE